MIIFEKYYVTASYIDLIYPSFLAATAARKIFMA